MHSRVASSASGRFAMPAGGRQRRHGPSCLRSASSVARVTSLSLPRHQYPEDDEGDQPESRYSGGDHQHSHQEYGHLIAARQSGTHARDHTSFSGRTSPLSLSHVRDSASPPRAAGARCSAFAGGRGSLRRLSGLRISRPRSCCGGPFHCAPHPHRVRVGVCMASSTSCGRASGKRSGVGNRCEFPM
jgi:hypothetical protein